MRDLTHKEMSALGGLASARSLNARERSERGKKAVQAREAKRKARKEYEASQAISSDLDTSGIPPILP
jgi:hypothetical protein